MSSFITRKLVLGTSFMVAAICLLLISMNSNNSVRAASVPKNCEECECREWEGWALKQPNPPLAYSYTENALKMGSIYTTIPAALVGPFYSTPDLCALTPGARANASI